MGEFSFPELHSCTDRYHVSAKLVNFRCVGSGGGGSPQTMVEVERTIHVLSNEHRDRELHIQFIPFERDNRVQLKYINERQNITKQETSHHEDLFPRLFPNAIG